MMERMLEVQIEKMFWEVINVKLKSWFWMYQLIKNTRYMCGIVLNTIWLLWHKNVCSGYYFILKMTIWDLLKSCSLTKTTKLQVKFALMTSKNAFLNNKLGPLELLQYNEAKYFSLEKLRCLGFLKKYPIKHYQFYAWVQHALKK